MSAIELKNAPVEDIRAFSVITESSQEIDLIHLLSTLFAAKKTIIAITFAAALAGLGVSFLMPQKWSSKAVITPPESSQLIELHRAMVELTVLDAAPNVDAGHVYQAFLKDFDSQALREEYLANSEYVKKLVNAVNSDDSVKLHQAIQETAAKFKSVNTADSKLPDAIPYTSWALSFTGPNPEEAREVLSGYIHFIAQRVNQDVVQNLRYSVELKSAVEKDKLELDKRNLENQHKVNIQRLGYSLEVANAAGIKKPVYSNGQAVKDDPDYSVALGADGLAEKLKIESALKDVAELNASVQNREYYLTKLEQVKVNDVDFQPFRYQMNPSLPLKKEGPGKSLIVVLAALLGLIGACGYVLMRNVMADRQKKLEIV
ncbi:LPS O-antigen length regulator Wzz(fepE) [Enterobacter sp. Ag1]|uniref:LPS O-antigen length regulator Wzz(fepE) n=2 Tax=Enterobacteriaceae TaxID=543 RepID=UPI000272973C|nr:LPS O-antigen length regulator Wzz(fepE) [Enterobacter sp. Ag1]EJF30855.1 LPS O-antigen length regulator [Enterobacter sp. Ag1]